MGNREAWQLNLPPVWIFEEVILEHDIIKIYLILSFRNCYADFCFFPRLFEGHFTAFPVQIWKNRYRIFLADNSTDF